MQSIILSDVNDLYGWYIGDVIAGPFGDEKERSFYGSSKDIVFFVRGCRKVSLYAQSLNS